MLAGNDPGTFSLVEQDATGERSGGALSGLREGWKLQSGQRKVWRRAANSCVW